MHEFQQKEWKEKNERKDFVAFFGVFGYLGFYVFTSIVSWPFFSPTYIDHVSGFNKNDIFRFEYDSLLTLGDKFRSD